MASGLAHQQHSHSQLRQTEDLILSEPVVADLDGGDMEEVDYESLPTSRLSTHLLAGGLAGMMEHCCMYPVDCVKVGGWYCMALSSVWDSV